MADTYYILTDKINGGTIIKRTDDGDYKYNVGTDDWDLTTMFWDYEGGFDSPYEGLYEQITLDKANKVIKDNKSTWKKYWDAAKKIAHTCYKNIGSPIKGVSYEDYVMLLSEYATDERERVVLVLSGLPLTGNNWHSVASSNGFPSYMIEALEAWHVGTKELFMEHNRWVLRAVIIELKYLNSRGDLHNPNKFASRYMLLNKGFSKDEIYAGVVV